MRRDRGRARDSAGAPDLVTRRAFLKQSAGIALASAFISPATAESVGEGVWPVLNAVAANQQLAPEQYPKTAIWGYNGVTPGPVLRLQQGERLRVRLSNSLPGQDTTIHWHGVRLPNDMDGVPQVTQPPVGPGQIFDYEFVAQDAGTYWYHSQLLAYEQVARGLHGALIVDEPVQVEVDRDLLWVIADWRFNPRAAIQDDFQDLHDLSHAGRLGSAMTINGRFAREVPLEIRAGERVRLRLVNACVARILGLRFADHDPAVIALDGQPVEPHALGDGGLILGPGMRADLVLDGTGSPGRRHAIEDAYYPGDRTEVSEIVYRDEAPLRSTFGSPPALPPNPVPEPDLARAERRELVLQGGAMGSLREARVRGRPTSIGEMLREHHLGWAINGVAGKGQGDAPLLSLKRGGHYVIKIRNDTGWDHPMHLHGHVFRLITRNGQPARYRPLGDTVLVSRRQSVEIALVADNPGLWMFQCQTLLHQEGGLAGFVRVA
ncbi:MAG: multicopper oxidase family protein [Betaproteobacteria bacterium]|nr:multicopper oxidase family protein [Betaproteobacteria bacterium]